MYDYYDFDSFKNILQYTLLSDINGFTFGALVNEWNQNEPISLDTCAKNFGFPNFEILIQDEYLEDVVTIERVWKNGRDQLVYKGMPRPEIEHIYRHMVNSEEHTKQKVIDKEKHKQVRASFPQYQSKVIEGKERILNLVASLGGENEPVPYKKLQEQYCKEYGVPLHGEELKKYFSKSKARSIFLTLCFEEAHISLDENCTGNMSIQLKHPLSDLRKMWKEKMEIVKQNPFHTTKNE